MDKRLLFTALTNALKKKGMQLAVKHGRPLGDKLAAHLSKAGVERGLLQEPLDLDAITERLRALRASGALSKEDLLSLTRQLKEHFISRFKS